MTLVVMVCVLAAVLAGGCGSGGGGAANASNGGKGCTYGVLPKAVGNQYWAAVGKGAREAAKALDVKVDYNGPTSADAAGQTEFIDSWIQKKYCAISVSANDPNALVPALQRAAHAGIKVSTFDADTAKSARAVFLNQVTFAGVGQTLVDEMVKRAGDQGTFLVVTSTLTAPNQSQWIDEMKKYIAAKYPGVKIGAILPGQEDQAKSRDVALGYLRAHPNTAGIWGMTDAAVSGPAEAKKQLGIKKTMPVIGIGPPSCCKTVLADGSADALVLWNPVDLGYATVYLEKAQAEGKLNRDQGLPAGRLGTLKYISDDTILLGKPAVFTKSNMDDFDF
ncbi:MAG TPA: substrate-binding domain-containing protein [Baekduia sp.]|uniref:substrate-binding domain-containing protein n=1 Tax=Baekduia sp. TaxID=2600305 RepID=UPI002D79FB15|nr:substrate-binding domain-containing protein [Baekduia sp.]HET6507969.1 substrate-binding domain-containing protein [Baekduia sp.]